MPLVEISALPQEGGDFGVVLDAVVADVSAALERPPESVWAVWRELAPGAYAVGHLRPEQHEGATHPALVRIYLNRSPEEEERVVDAVERAIRRTLGLDVFVIVERP